MNTIESNLMEAEQRELHAWCAEVRATHALGRDSEAGSARYKEIEASRGSHVAQFTPEELGNLYFTHEVALPAWPFPAPAWAVKTRVAVGMYPEIAIEFRGKNWGTDERFNARIEQDIVVFVDNFANGDETIDRTGDLHRSEANIYVPQHPETLSVEEALSLASAVENAAHELARHQ